LNRLTKSDQTKPFSSDGKYIFLDNQVKKILIFQRVIPNLH